MTDNEIIRAFKGNDQKGIRWAYNAWRVPFRTALSFRVSHLPLDEDDLCDVYQEAFIRIQQHILADRIVPDHEGSLLAYLKEIGFYVAQEMVRARKEIPVSRVSQSDSDDEQESVNTPEDEAEIKQIHETGYDPLADYETVERERIIREQVMLMGQPCAPLLIGVLWQNLSMAQIAKRLHYSNADSAKAQKAKCMKKVKTFVKQRLIEYGYGY